MFSCFQCFCRETVSLFLHFTVNPKPPVGFLDVPRCSMTGKEQTVCRFNQAACQVQALALFTGQVPADWESVGIQWHLGQDQVSSSFLNVFKWHFQFSDLLWTGGSSLLALDSTALSTDLQSIQYLKHFALDIHFCQVWCHHPADTYGLWQTPWIKWNFILQVGCLIKWFNAWSIVMGPTPRSGRCSRSHLKFSQIQTILLWVSNS